MKKILYVALAALMLISCDPNAPKIPSKDKKMLDKVSTGMLSVLGQKQKDVKATMKELGFKSFAGGMAPERLGLPAKTAADGLMFAYENEAWDAYMDAMLSEDFEELVDALNESKAILLMVELTFDDANKVNGGYAYFIASQEIKNVNNIYLNCSKNIFLSLDKNKEWSGSLCEAEDWEKESEYENYASAKKRDKFEEDFAEYEYPFAFETGADDFDKTSRRTYGIRWSSDASVDEKEMEGLVMASIEFGLESSPEPEPEPEPEP